MAAQVYTQQSMLWTSLFACWAPVVQPLDNLWAPLDWHHNTPVLMQLHAAPLEHAGLAVSEVGCIAPVQVSAQVRMPLVTLQWHKTV